MNGNVEKFIVDLGFSDKEAVKGLQDFLKKVEKAKPEVGAVFGGSPKGSRKGVLDSHVKARAKFELNHEKALYKNEYLNAKAKVKLESDHEEALFRNKQFNEKKLSAQRIANAKREASLNKFKNSATYQNSLSSLGKTQSSAYLARAKSFINSGDVNSLRSLNTEIRNNVKAHKAMQSEISKSTRLQKGFNDSTKHAVRSLVSIYALASSANFIKTVGQGMEGMEAGMLAASENAEVATENIGFLRKESKRLGFDLVETSKAFVKLAASASGKVSNEDIKESFLGIVEAGRVFQLSTDDVTGSVRAIQQMFSKAGITAEELKLQLGDRMPIAMRALEISTGKTSKQLLKMMEQGQLGMEYIVPFTKAMRTLANENDALNEALASGKTAQDRFMVFLKDGADQIYKGGFEEGLTHLFNDLIENIDASSSGMEGLGKIFKLFFNIVRGVGNLLVPILDTITTLLGGVASAFNVVLDTDLGSMVGVLGLLILYMRNLTKAAILFGVELKIALAPILAVVAGLDEIYSLFDDKRVSATEAAVGEQGFAAAGKTALQGAAAFASGQGMMYLAEMYKKVAVNVLVENKVDGVARSVEDQMQISNSHSIAQGR